MYSGDAVVWLRANRMGIAVSDAESVRRRLGKTLAFLCYGDKVRMKEERNTKSLVLKAPLYPGRSAVL